VASEHTIADDIVYDLISIQYPARLVCVVGAHCEYVCPHRLRHAGNR
jgi:hypothetical protein